MIQIKMKFRKIFPKTDFIFNREIRKQLLASLVVNIITFSHGIALGWSAPSLKKLSSDETPLNFKITLVEASWIASLVGLGSVIGNLVLCNLINVIGRKPCLLLMALPNACLWILTYFANRVEYLFAARFIGGITGGSSIALIPLFINEIADARFRGGFQAFFTIAFNLGILIGYILASKINYFMMPCTVIALPIIFLFLFSCYFPETPHYLIRKSNDENAMKSFRFYRNYSVLTPAVEQEFQMLKAAIMDTKSGNDIKFSNFFRKSALKAYSIVFILLIMNQLCGVYAFVTYMSDIFTLSGAPLEPDTCTIIIGITQLLGNATTIFLIDNCGRKFLIILSSIGVILGLTAFGCFSYLKDFLDLTSYAWIPLALMIFIVFLGNIGIVSVTVISVVEILPLKIRSTAFSCSLALLSFLVFITLKNFPIFMHAYGISITMWSFAAVTSVCLIFVKILLPETKGKPMESD